MLKTTKCPVCRKETCWKNNDYKPFCSRQCKLTDLGHWADGSYKVENVDFSATEEEIEEAMEHEKIKF
ncbi:MAG: DNA gyrase inhibitor YacG [Proteobacteria bacterium]|nr:DNA gyrase inhibitor YacG [Pseudomonadota bacterium]